MNLRVIFPGLFGICWFFGLAQAGEVTALRSEILNLIKNQKAVYGIAFHDYTSGAAVLINENDRMHAASTMKIPVMMRLFEMIDKGELALSNPVLVRNEFTSIADGSKFTITVDSDEALYQSLGKAVTVEELIVLMIIRSSNLATNLLIEIADPTQINRLLSDLGIADLTVLRGVEDLKAFEQNMNNQSSAKAMLMAIESCLSSPNFSPATRKKMLEILRMQEFNDMIPAGLPADSGALVAHKTGSISRVEHDAAVIDLPDGRRYALVIFSRDFDSDRERVKLTARKISALVYRFVTQPEMP